MMLSSSLAVGNRIYLRLVLCTCLVVSAAANDETSSSCSVTGSAFISFIVSLKALQECIKCWRLDPMAAASDVYK